MLLDLLVTVHLVYFEIAAAPTVSQYITSETLLGCSKLHRVTLNEFVLLVDLPSFQIAALLPRKQSR